MHINPTRLLKAAPNDAGGSGAVPSEEGYRRSHLLVSAVVINERRTARSGAHGFDRAEEHVVAADRAHLDDAAVKRDDSRDEDRTASRQRQPVSGREPIPADDAGAPSENVRHFRAVVPQRVDAEYAVLDHDRICLAAPI